MSMDEEFFVSAIDVSMDEARRAYAHMNHIHNYLLTPLLPWGTVQKKRVRLEVRVKPEYAREMGTFKTRGAEWFSFITMDVWKNLGREKPSLVTASAGNHAQGVALAADRYGLEAIIFMPENVPEVKLAKVKSMRGADVRIGGANFNESLKVAEEFARAGKNRVFVHPYEDSKIIAGQASIGVEMLSQICTSNNYLQLGGHLSKSERPDVIIAPLGGGGLVSGLGAAFHEFNKGTGNSVKVIGVQTEAADSMYRSWKSGSLQGSTNPRAETIADGINVKQASQTMLDTVTKYVDQVVVVTERDIKAGIYAASVHELLKVFRWQSSEVETPHIPGRRLPNGDQRYNHDDLSRLEGAAAAPLAAVLFSDKHGELKWDEIAKGKDTLKVYCVLTGSNIDDVRFNKVLDEMSHDSYVQGRLADALN